MYRTMYRKYVYMHPIIYEGVCIYVTDDCMHIYTGIFQVLQRIKYSNKPDASSFKLVRVCV